MKTLKVDGNFIPYRNVAYIRFVKTFDRTFKGSVTLTMIVVQLSHTFDIRQSYETTQDISELVENHFYSFLMDDSQVVFDFQKECSLCDKLLAQED